MTLRAGDIRRQELEMLDTVGMVHMNGRVFHPGIGRFLSADPLVPHPASTQSFNRYSYAANRPLSRIDPSGFTDRNLLHLRNDRASRLCALFDCVTLIPGPGGFWVDFPSTVGATGEGGSDVPVSGRPSTWVPFDWFGESGSMTRDGASPLRPPRRGEGGIEPGGEAPERAANEEAAREQVQEEPSDGLDRKCGLAATYSIGLAGNIAALLGLQGELRVGATSDLQLFATASGGGNWGAQVGAAASLVFGGGVHLRPHATGFSTDTNVAAWVQGVFGLGGGAAVRADLSGAGYTAQGRLSVGEYISWGSIGTEVSATLASPPLLCD
jgi:RHS repeat-associated protein